MAFPSTTADEAGKKHQYWNDGFGRLVEADEPDSGGNFSIATCYQYDLLNNLTSATQRGGTTDQSQWRTRSFSYDDLSRVTQSTTPEAGSVTYSYTSSGSPCSGDPSLPCSRTDGRSITTTYSYDGLNRLTSKMYSDSTPSVTYYYDQPSYNGLTIANGKGRRTGMSDGTGQTAWSYDAAGNVLTKRQTIAGITNRISYTYNLNSSVATMTTPNGHTYTYGYSNALRAVSLVDNGNGYTYVQNAHYAAPGLLTSAQHGLNLAITETNYFNNRLEPTVLSATGGQTVLNLGYNFVLPGNVNNGSVYQIQNNRDSSNNRSFQYSYDALNRLQTAGTMAGASSPWTTTYSYDNWGNLLQKSTTGSGGDPNMGPLTVDAHNHVNPGSYPYDGAGNLTFDGVNYLKFDAENRMNPVTGYVYSYDGDNHRVEKNNAGSITYYWYDDNFNVISTTGNISRDYVYFDGRRIAFYSATSGNQHYYWSDHLGSARTMSNSDGSTIEWEGDYYPFGNKNVLNNNVDNYFLFTGYEFDYELGDNYADNREQLPVLGRFVSPDPIGGDPANPQSLNRYAYVMNNPLSFVDPSGLDCQLSDGSIMFDNEYAGPMEDPAQICNDSYHGTYLPVPNSSTTNANTDPVPLDPSTLPVNQLPPLDGNGGYGDGGEPSIGQSSGTNGVGNCSVVVSCTPTQNPLTQGHVHCGITTGANGTYTRYDGGPNGSGGDSGHGAMSRLKVTMTGGTLPPAGQIIFNSSVPCGVVSCIGQVANQINTARAPYTLLPMVMGLTPATSNSAAQTMTSSCTLNVPYPSNATGANVPH